MLRQVRPVGLGRRPLQGEHDREVVALRRVTVAVRGLAHGPREEVLGDLDGQPGPAVPEEVDDAGLAVEHAVVGKVYLDLHRGRLHPRVSHAPRPVPGDMDMDMSTATLYRHHAVSMPKTVTGPGVYRTRSGEAVTVEGFSGHAGYIANGSYQGGPAESWYVSGRVLTDYESPNDIVGPA